MGLMEIKNLTLDLDGNKILDRLNLDIWDGHVHAIVGPNGAGKSTLACTIMGLAGYRDIQGDILFEGQSIRALAIDERARKGITLAWQEPSRYEGLSVRDFMRASGKGKSEIDLKQILSRTGLEPYQYWGRAVDKTLSGGERKKLELASILAMQPKIVFLDEPDSGIDIASLDKIFEAIRILKTAGSTVILITHSLAVLEQAEHAFLMCHGRIVDKGETEKIIPYFQGKCIPCHHKNLPEYNGDEVKL